MMVPKKLALGLGSEIGSNTFEAEHGRKQTLHVTHGKTDTHLHIRGWANVAYSSSRLSGERLKVWMVC